MENRNIYIVRCGEVALKGLNKPYFERMLIERIRKVLKPYKETEVRREDGLIMCVRLRIFQGDSDPRNFKSVWVDSISPAVEIETDMEAIGRAAVAYMQQQIEERYSNFQSGSKACGQELSVNPEIARRIGARILIECKVLKVDVHNPECKLYVHVRDRSFIYEEGFRTGDCPGTNAKGWCCSPEASTVP